MVWVFKLVSKLRETSRGCSFAAKQPFRWDERLERLSKVGIEQTPADDEGRVHPTEPLVGDVRKFRVDVAVLLKNRVTPSDHVELLGHGAMVRGGVVDDGVKPPISEPLRVAFVARGHEPLPREHLV